MISKFVLRMLVPCALSFCCVTGFLQSNAQAQSGFHGNGWIVESNQGPAALILTGNAGGIGNYVCLGELEFVGDAENGFIGSGVAVFFARNGDRLVGVVTLANGLDGQGEIAFSWRDSITLSNGRVVRTTGRFIKHRPPGAVNRFQASPLGGPNGIIAILIGI